MIKILDYVSGLNKITSILIRGLQKGRIRKNEKFEVYVSRFDRGRFQEL